MVKKRRSKNYLRLGVLAFFFLTGCSNGGIQEALHQDIVFESYTMEISENFLKKNVFDHADPRIAGKIIAMYGVDVLDTYGDNLIVSTDILAPDMTFNDYIKISLEGIAKTWRNYKSLTTSSKSFACQALRNELRIQSFHIDRLLFDKTQTERIYFVQGYLLHNRDITLVSLSTSNKKNVRNLEEYVASISCRKDQ